LVARLTNGTDTVVVNEDQTVSFFTPPSYNQTTITVEDIIDPTATMKIIFEIEINDPGDLSEAAVDFFEAFDADPVGLNENFLEDVYFNIAPNPTSGDFIVNYDINNIESTANLIIYDVFGKAVYTERLNQHFGKVVVKETLPSGVYFVQIKSGTEVTKGMKLIVD